MSIELDVSDENGGYDLTPAKEELDGLEIAELSFWAA
jgi:hypothetical protein